MPSTRCATNLLISSEEYATTTASRASVLTYEHSYLLIASLEHGKLLFNGAEASFIYDENLIRLGDGGMRLVAINRAEIVEIGVN